MLTQEFAPAHAVRLATRGYGGSSTLPGGIQPGSLRSKSARAGEVGPVGVETPAVMKPVAAVAGAAGALGASEFLGTVAGWGVRKTAGNLPGAVGKAAYNIGSIPAGPVNGLYQVQFKDLFTKSGRQQFYTNMIGTIHNYATGGHVSMATLEGTRDAGVWKNTAGDLPYLKGAMKPTYGERWTSWKPWTGFRAPIEGAETLVSSGKEWGVWERELKRMAAKGFAPKAFEATAMPANLNWLERVGHRLMNGRAMSGILGIGLAATAGLAAVRLSQHFSGELEKVQQVHEDTKDKKQATWDLLSQPENRAAKARLAELGMLDHFRPDRPAKPHHHEVLGEKLSAWRLLMDPNSLPGLTRQARDSMIEHVVPGAVNELAGGLDKYSTVNGLRGFKMLPLVAGQLLGRGISEFKPSSDFLGSYDAIGALQKAHQPVPAEAYAALIEAASPDVRRAGGAKAPITQGLAAEYAQLQMPAAAVVKEIEAKAPFVARAQAVHAQLLAAQEAAAAKPAHDGPIVATQQPEVMAQAAEDKPSLKVAAKALEHATEHQGRVNEAQRQVGAR